MAGPRYGLSPHCAAIHSGRLPCEFDQAHVNSLHACSHFRNIPKSPSSAHTVLLKNKVYSIKLFNLFERKGLAPSIICIKEKQHPQSFLFPRRSQLSVLHISS